MKCKRCGHETEVFAISRLWMPSTPLCNMCVKLICDEWLIRKQEIDLDLHNDNSGKAF